MIRLGLIAASRIAKPAVVDPAADVDGVELTAIAARDPERARSTAAAWGIPTVFDSYEALDRIARRRRRLHRHAGVAASPAGDRRDRGRQARAVREAVRRQCRRCAADRRRCSHVTRRRRDGGVPLAVPPVRAADPRRARLRRARRAAARRGRVRHPGRRHRARRHPVEPAARRRSDDGPRLLLDPVGALRRRQRPGCRVGRGGVSGGRCRRLARRRVAVAIGRDRARRVVDDRRRGRRRRAPPRRSASAARCWRPTRSRRRTAGRCSPSRPTPARSTHEVDRSATYFHQLVAFRDAIVDGVPFPTTADDGVRNMEIIDACYRAAGLEPRPSA